jgi:hypothetical protein
MLLCRLGAALGTAAEAQQARAELLQAEGHARAAGQRARGQARCTRARFGARAQWQHIDAWMHGCLRAREASACCAACAMKTCVKRFLEVHRAGKKRKLRCSSRQGRLLLRVSALRLAAECSAKRATPSCGCAHRGGAAGAVLRKSATTNATSFVHHTHSFKQLCSRPRACGAASLQSGAACSSRRWRCSGCTA